MALWFAQADGPVTPSRVGKRCVQISSLSRDIAATSTGSAGVAGRFQGGAVAGTGRLASTTVNQETETAYLPCGRRRIASANPSTSLLPQDLAERTTYSHVPWETHSKRIIPPPKVVEKERAVTPRRAAAPPPFGTSNDPEVVPFRLQKRLIDTPAAFESQGEKEYVKKRSRTPPAGMVDRCASEGFCVLYSVKPATGGQVQHMSMVSGEKIGKSSKFSEKDFVRQRDAHDAKADRISTTKQRHQIERAAIVRPEPHPVGIKRSTTPTAGTYRLQTPFATNLPTKHDHIGVAVHPGKPKPRI